MKIARHQLIQMIREEASLLIKEGLDVHHAPAGLDAMGPEEAYGVGYYKGKEDDPDVDDDGHLSIAELIRMVKSIASDLDNVSESYDTNRDGDLDPDELRRIARELEGSKPLVKRGGRHDRIPGYNYYATAGVHVRNDYNPRTDYNNTLDKVLAKMGIRI